MLALGEQVKAYRKKNNISMEKFAELCGVAAKTIQRLENKNICSDKTLKKLKRIITINLNKNFTPSQRCAIESNSKNLQITAGAGAGKTAVAEEKIVALIEDGVKPRELIVCTFTEKAANELNVRVKKRLKENGLYEGSSEMLLGTIHGVCLRLLQEFDDKYNSYSILDNMKNVHFINRHFKRLQINKVKNLKNGKPMLRYLDTLRFIKIVNLVTENPVNEAEIPSELKYSIVAYKELLKSERFFDFTTIQETLLRELKDNEKLRELIKNNIKYIIVDEYQDVNYLQECIISEVIRLGIRAIVIGDADQAIYQFRGSDYSYLTEFKNRYENVEVVKLQENFRSTEGIVEIAEASISNNRIREPKNMVSSRKGYEKGDITYLNFENRKEESKFIAERISELLKIGMNPNEIGILIRKNDMADPIIYELKERNIPYEVESVNKLLETLEIQASISIFKYLNEDIEEADLIDAWRFVEADLSEDYIKEAICSIEKYKPGKWQDVNKKVLNQEYLLQEIYQKFFSNLDIINEKTESIEVEKILYNLGKFTQLINDFEIINYDLSPKYKVSLFCSFLENSKGQYPEGYLENIYRKIEGVRIMTVHKSKGLQFSAVFVPGLVKNIFPIKRKSGTTEWHFLPEASLINSDIIRATDERLLEDERRLFYVAVTRSRKFLFLTYANYSDQAKKESVFLEEVKNASGYIYKYISSLGDYSKREKWISIENEEQVLHIDYTTIVDYFSCPYNFKLSKLYGFMQPINLRMGYGHSVHNMAKDLNKFALNNSGGVLDDEILEVVKRNFYLPFIGIANEVREHLFYKANECMQGYVRKNKEKFKEIEFVEKYIEVELDKNIIISGRIDLVRKKDMLNKWHIIIVDYKTGGKIPSEIEQKIQMEIYAMGYKNLTGTNADSMEIIDIEGNKVIDCMAVIPEELEKTTSMIKDACTNIINNNLERRCNRKKCMTCYNNKICLSRKDKSNLI